MQSHTFKTTLLKQHRHNKARIVEVTTPHGTFTTPAFMPVGTRAVVNNMTPRDLAESGSKIILGGNTYHMLCTPGMETIKSLGGMHKLMDWDKPMLTDSGGFQAYSLAANPKICKIKEDGAHFRHPQSGSIIHLTPEASIAAQKIIGADIIMAFDHCAKDTDDQNQTLAAMERTHRWLKQSVNYHNQNPYSAYGLKQALFGIIQGGLREDLRKESAAFITSQDVDGIAIGGEAIGFDMAKTLAIINWVEPMLPANKVRYTMGVGLQPQDLIDVVAEGIDVFDCVAPTRNARHGSLYCGKLITKGNWLEFISTDSSDDRSRILIKKSIYAQDLRPIMEDCTCYTCKHYTRAYLHYLFREKLLAYSNLACIHNIHVMHSTCEKMQACIIENS